jgi:DNA repair protein RecN (Recombination protein N)
MAKARVEGAFDLSHAPMAHQFLRDNDYPLDDHELIIARDVGSDGRSRIRINGQLANASTLRELGSLLVDLHGQHEHQLLLKPETHGVFLDQFGDASHQTLRERTRDTFNTWKASQKRLNELSSSEQNRAQRLDMLQFQAQEIDASAPQPEEDVQLQDERARLLNAEKLRTAAALCRDALIGGEEAGAMVLLGQALKAAREIEAVDSSVAEWASELQSAIYEIEDAATQARAYADSLEADPLRLDEIETRLHRLNRLKRKYGDSLERVLAYREEIEEELGRLNISEDELSSLRHEVETLHQKFLQTATALSQARKALAKRFQNEVVSHLKTLAMERTRFEVGFETDETGSADGTDRIEFLISANPGQPLRPLARIASGGEISRVMLSLRSALFAPTDDTPASGVIPVLVFDEVDTGIGGVTAEAVGEKMRELARGFQVFCVTHLPQIARRADSHYRVLKESDDAQTRVGVTRLDGEDRVHELARMMGRESDANLRHARELLNGVANSTASNNQEPAEKKKTRKK